MNDDEGRGGSPDVFERLDALAPEHRMRPGLDRVRALLSRLGDPHVAFPTAIIAGSNGKGSAAAMLASIGRAAGLRVGCYTSPHLHHIEERFLVDLNPISRSGLATHLDAVLSASDAEFSGAGRGERPTYFEILTAVAFRYFAEARVDLAVLEVGLGGRLDATNVTRPRVALIMPLTEEHVDWLGDDLGVIAGEKFAVVPPSGFAVVARQPEEAINAIRTEASMRGATLLEATSFPSVVRHVDERLRYTFDCEGRLRSYAGLEVGLAGRHQMENAVCALLAAEALDRRRMRVSADAIWAGLRNVCWPGRCEWIDGPPRVLLDAAHNAAAAEALAAYLTELRDRGAFRRLHLVLGVLRDKQVDGIAQRLLPLADSLVTTEPLSPRSHAADALLLLADAPRRRFALPDPGAALERALDLAGPEDVVCVTGSIYLLGAVRPLLVDVDGAG